MDIWILVNVRTNESQCWSQKVRTHNIFLLEQVVFSCVLKVVLTFFSKVIDLKFLNKFVLISFKKWSLIHLFCFFLDNWSNIEKSGIPEIKHNIFKDIGITNECTYFEPNLFLGQNKIIAKWDCKNILDPRLTGILGFFLVKAILKLAQEWIWKLQSCLSMQQYEVELALQCFLDFCCEGN